METIIVGNRNSEHYSDFNLICPIRTNSFVDKVYSTFYGKKEEKKDKEEEKYKLHFLDIFYA